MERIPITKMGDMLIVSLQTEIHDSLAIKLQEDLSATIDKYSSKGVLIDVTGLSIVDSYIGRVISDISSVGKLLNAEMVLVGIKPAVAITLVELGLDFSDVTTALTVERGLEKLEKIIYSEGKNGKSSSKRRP